MYSNYINILYIYVIKLVNYKFKQTEKKPLKNPNK